MANHLLGYLAQPSEGSTCYAHFDQPRADCVVAFDSS